MTPDPLALASRSGLPEDLRFLLGSIPRPDWHAHPNFGPLTRFYLDRHAMFRELSDLMAADLRARLDGADGRGRHHGRFLSLAGLFLRELHTHHMVEDHHYFPALMRLEARLGRGFAILERDHAALDARLHGFAADVRALAAAPPGDQRAARAMLAGIEALAPLIARHLDDEEEIVIPLMLDRGEAALGV
ncbi:hemerythrin domain-containing protein [Limibaculum sp. FT325]|uniref:hemerythrin domain-containing protein n=1 Tax=Thermohalobaculum sediminis TaxID=2939436 RepID=UPI0020BF2C3A|nr:hemerythrin domain-containing protein [Limibaculum sediminis]MCL5775870.1 hemerythrin domain-containing protein [Limibaculum sediminis]